MLISRVLTAAAAVALPLAVGSIAADAAPIATFSAFGANPAAIQGSVDGFRSALGTLNPNVVGSFGSGRREINWDGVPDGFSSPNAFPPNFFNVNSPRGTVFSTPGSGFQVSANAVNPTSAPVEFGNINPVYPGLFQTFSAQRLFTPIGSNIVDVNFFVPGSNAPALTRGFGSVFTDVDLANTTSLQFYDANNVLLDTLYAPGQSGSETLSFLGADYGSAIISRVRITNGNAILSGNESFDDLVVMDDFIYGEPIGTVGVPEPGSMALLVMGMVGLRLAGSQRRNRRAA